MDPSSSDRRSGHPPAPGFAALFTPKIVTVLREGYGLAHLRADMVAGLTVAIVALPLSMAIAIASGVSPAQGLYAAIIGGFLVSLLGGSRFQIGGPAGAFIVLVAATLEQHGPDGLILATLMSGVILIATGSEVALAMDAAAELEQQGKAVRVVSMPSAYRFNGQDADYRESVLPKAVTKRIAIEAGHADYWYKYVGLDGRVIGMTTYGESAPAGELFKHFGFTVENIVKQANELLG